MSQKQEKAAAAAKEEKGGKKSESGEVAVTRRTQPPAAVRAARQLWPVSTWEREIDRVFDDFRRLLPWPRLWGAERWPAEVELRMPAVDVYEEGDEIVVKAEIPGMSKEDIEVNLSDSVLTLTGEKKKEEEIKEHDYYRCERSFGSFSRTIQLPSEVKADQAKATFKDGVLEVHLPKTEEAKQKAIKVKVE
jgi:HSP20 family protein